MGVFEERDKLDDVTLLVLLVPLGVEGRLVCIKLFHAGEVGAADANDDDGEWETGGGHNRINRLLHVHDGTIGQDQQDRVLLIILRLLLHLLHAVSVHVLEDGCEVGWPEQAGLRNRVLIHAKNALHAVALGVEDVAIEGEAVANLHTFEETAAEAEHWVLLIRIILLQNASNTHDGMLILIGLPTTHKMQRVRIRDLTIRRSEIHCNLQADLAPTEDVVQECDSLLHDDFAEGDAHLSVTE